MSQPKPLTTRQELFVAAYLGEARGNATEAARLAGYAKPRQEGHRLLTNADIAARVQGHIERKFADADTVLAELTDVALAEWRDFVTVKTDPRTGDTIDVRMDLSNKVKALELLGKFHQLFTDRQSIDLDGGLRIEIAGMADDELP